VAGHPIFISYRREDALHPAGFLHHLLVERFGSDRVFMDLDSLRPGDYFPDVIRRYIERCAVLIALIGDDWLALPGEDGKPRIHDPEDWVRVEIETALELENVQVIPVLVEGQRMPKAADMPDSLAVLTKIQGHRLRDESFSADAQRLIRYLEPLLDAVPQPKSLPPPDRTLASDVRRAIFRDGTLFVIHAEDDQLFLDRIAARTDQREARAELSSVPEGARVGLSVSSSAVVVTVDRTVTIFDHELQRRDAREFVFVSSVIAGTAAAWVHETVAPPSAGGDGDPTTVRGRLTRLGIDPAVQDTGFPLGDSVVGAGMPPGCSVLPTSSGRDTVVAILADRGGGRVRGRRPSQRVVRLDALRPQAEETRRGDPPWVRQVLRAGAREYVADDMGLRIGTHRVLGREATAVAEWVDSGSGPPLGLIAAPGLTTLLSLQSDGKMTPLARERGSMLLRSQPLWANLRGPSHPTVFVDDRYVWLSLAGEDGRTILLGVSPTGDAPARAVREQASIALGADQEAVYCLEPEAEGFALRSASLAR
jgi:TIR domain